jgi:Acyl-CoA dehydrogenase, middle domain/Acyl-CoA dehydrogenase, N-terminal domain
VQFEFTELNAAELALQGEVRAFLAATLPRGSFEPGLGMAGRKDPRFSQQLAARGWVGMSLPRAYGGGDRSAVERFVVAEELLRWGAPVGHHWVADRQSGPLIAKVGTPEQQERFLPAICRGELSFCIGMSEPDSGSDLASVKARATRVEGGWTVDGTKVWTTGAHEHDWMIALVRTSDAEDRHAGLSQVLVDLRGPGVEVHPIPFLDGTSDFNEVVLTGVFVPDTDVVGVVGMGWSQIGQELSFERGGPDRWLSTYLVLEQFLREHADELDDEVVELVGAATARFWGLRNLSLSVARAIDADGQPAVQAALVKEMGTRFEQDLLEGLRRLVDLEPSPTSSSLFERLLANAILTSPAFTIRGGTIEILRSVAAKGLRS